MPVTYADAAKAGFVRLVALYKQPKMFAGNFWFGGNALHTCLAYLLNARVQDQNTTQILEVAYNDVYAPDSPESIGGRLVPVRPADETGWWRDDYGWWGNAFVLALNNRDKLGYGGIAYAPLFNNIAASAHFCWEQLKDSASGLYFGAEDANDYAHGKAPNTADVYKGGVYNVPLPYNRAPLQGRNSVTNEGYWLLSQGLLKRNPKDPGYTQAVQAIQNWYAAWLKDGGLLSTAGLVLERPTGNGVDPVWCWSGDQGLLFRALTNAGNPDTATTIAKSAFAKLEAGGTILHEDLGFMKFTSPNLAQFVIDYATGKGIFLRGLVEPGGTPPVSTPFADQIKLNAAAVWTHQLDTKTHQFAYNWNAAPGHEPNKLTPAGDKTQALCDLVMQACGQDALNAAILIAPTEFIRGS